MLTDDDVLTRLRGSFSSSVADVLPDPALLTRVRHAHHKSVRRQRLLAPAGIAVVGLAAAGMYAVRPSAGQPAEVLAATPTSEPSVEAGPTVTLFDYTFTLPADYVVTSEKRGDQSAFFTAAKGEQQLKVTIYRGPIADAQAKVEPPEPSALQRGTRAGFPFQWYGYAAGGPECVSKGPERSLGSDHATGPCGQERGETRITTAPHELVQVMTSDVSLTTVQAILDTGL